MKLIFATDETATLHESYTKKTAATRMLRLHFTKTPCWFSSNSAAASLAPRSQCRVNGALLDQLHLITGLALFVGMNPRAEPCEKLYATDASPDGAGGCAASITQDGWLALYDLAAEKGGVPDDMSAQSLFDRATSAKNMMSRIRGYSPS